MKGLTGLTTIAGSLIISGSANATTVANLSIGGDLTLNNTAALTVAGYDFSVTGNTSLNSSSQLTHSLAAGVKTYNGNVTLNSGTIWGDNVDVVAISFGGNLQNNGGTFNAGTGVHTFTGLGKTFGGTITIPNIAITGSYTNNGVLTAGATLSGTGSLTQGTFGGSGPTLNLGGSLTINTLTANINPNTVRYSLIGPQAIRSMTYHHLITAGTSTKTLGGDVIVNGNLTIGSGTILDVSTFNYGVSLAGNWVNSVGISGFVPRSGTVTLLGSVSQDMSSSTAFYNLNVNNSSGVTISSDQTINNLLTLTNGKITTGNNDVILSLSGSITGVSPSKYINGNLQKIFTTGSASFLYDVGDASTYTPVTLAFTNITVGGGVSVKSTNGVIQYLDKSGLDTTHYVHRFWTFVIPSAFRFGSYDANFTYAEADKDAGSDASQFIVKRRNTILTVWDTTPISIGSKTSTSTQATGIAGPSTFGTTIFAIGQPDTTVPFVTNVDSATNGAYKAGIVVSIQVTFSEAVDVSGTPQLQLETGDNDRFANYYSGKGSNMLVFRYTVLAGDASSDLDYISPSALTLNNGTIADYGGHNALLGLQTPGTAGSLGYNNNIVIDTTSPTVTGVDSTSPDGTYENGTLNITVTFSEPVIVVTTGGTPALTLETGAVDRAATFLNGSGTSSLSFTYIITLGDNSPDLDYVSTGSLAANSGTIKDAAGNNAVLALPAPGATGSLGANRNIVLNTVAAVTNVTSSSADNPYRTGNIPITVTFTKNVFVTGVPILNIETGDTDRLATYTSGSGLATLTFTYAIQPGDTSADLDYVDAASLSFGTGTIKDGSGNNAYLPLPPPGASGSLGFNKNIVIDTTPPDTTIDSQPSHFDKDTTPTFTFSGNDGAGSGIASFMCKMDAGATAPCTSPFTQSPAIADGPHTFYVYAIDNAGNSDASAASYLWTVDATPPNTTILTRPPSLNNDNTPSFTFSGDDTTGSGIASFVCKVDGDPGFTACTSGSPLTTLADGYRTFYVAAVDNAGNVDPSPDTYSWTLDATAPDTTIINKPANPDTDNTPTFTFSGNDGTGSGVASFSCAMDSGTPSTCTSGVTWTALADGSHTFYVAAVDNIGNIDPTPDTYTWLVDTTPPNTTIDTKPAQYEQDTTPTFTFSGNDGTGSGVASFMCKMDAGTYSTCVSGLTWAALPDGSHTFSVYAIDLAGNTDLASPATFTWMIDNLAPNTTITVFPNPADTTPNFSFNGNDGTGSGAASFMCKMDDAVDVFILHQPLDFVHIGDSARIHFTSMPLIGPGMSMPARLFMTGP